MPVNTTAVSVTHSGNGSATAMPVSFQFDDPAHLRVILVNGTTNTTLVMGTDYTVAHSAPGETGTVNMTVAPASGTSVRIERYTPVQQPDTLQNQGVLLANALERIANRGVMIAQEQAARGGGGGSTDVSALQAEVDALEVEVAGKAPIGANYLTWGNNAVLTNERSLSFSSDFTVADSGANSSLTVSLAAPGGGTDTGATLRTDLATAEATKGADLVAFLNTSTGATGSTVTKKLGERISIADFGGVGDDTTDNATAFTNAQACTAPCIYLPEGTYYTTSAASTLSKHYYGPGKIRTSGGDRLPGRFTYLTARPATGTGSDLNRYFSADLSKVEAEYFLLGNAANNLRKGVNEPYYESATTPHFQVFTNRSGWSGISALITGPTAAGSTSVTVNSTAGFAVNDKIIFLDAATETASAETTITAIGTNSLTFTPATTVAYTTNDRVTHGKRTMNPLYYQQINHHGGGDSYALLTRVNVGYTPLAGQTHVFFTATGGLYGGDLSAESSGVFLTGFEANHIDNGYDVAATGAILNFQRSNAGGDRGAYWVGVQLKSEGSQPMDAGYNLIGKFKAGVDLVKGNFGTDKAAISMKRGDRIIGNSSATEMFGYSLVGNVIGNSWWEYSENFDGWSCFVTGNNVMQVLSAEVRVLNSADTKLDGGRLYGTALHNHASGMQGAAAHFVGSGTYTPTLTLLSNVDSATPFEWHYLRVGRVVHVTGQITIDAATSGTLASLEASLPITTTLAGGRQVSGVFATADLAGSPGRVFGNTSTHRAALQIIAPSAAAQSYSITFSYLVN